MNKKKKEGTVADDIEVIRLYRKSVENDLEFNMNNGSAEENHSYFATDYFDILDVQRIQNKDDFKNILDIRNVNSKGIAVQTYALYCSSKMIEKYDKVDKKYLGCPFEMKNKKLYLSIIQIHITPQVIAQMEYSPRNIWENSGNILMQNFLDDLYAILDLYSQSTEDEEFRARVYFMLSAGDFAVVIRSDKVDTAYNISSYIRKRRPQVKMDTKQSTADYILYKTYTLLTMNDIVVSSQASDKEETAKGNHFVVRGVYSNKYWAEQSIVEKHLEDNKLVKIDKFYHLTGRYDFSLYLTEKEFFQIVPLIRKAKGLKNETNENYCPAETDSQTVKYMKYMLWNKYLSCINERYLIKEHGDAKESPSNFVFLRDGYRDAEEISDKNEKLIDGNKILCDELIQQIEKIHGYRKQIHQSLRLLKKQLILCDCINELSDTRIYASSLAKQLEVVLNSAKYYVERIIENQNENIYSFSENFSRDLENSLNNLEDYLGRV